MRLDASSSRLDRRCALSTSCALASLLSSSWPAGANEPSRAAVAVVAGGFLIPSEQYQSLATAFEDLGFASALYADESTLSQPQPLDMGADSLLRRAEACASQSQLGSSAPLILLGHSRGCKTSVIAAAKAKRRVAAMILLDPVDRTGPDPQTVLPVLETLKVPTAILGTGQSAFDCAPPESNYERFAEALKRASTPRLIGRLPRAGHTQFVDNRRVLSVDVCTTGKDRDAAIREVAIATARVWSTAALQPPKEASSARMAAAAQLDQQNFSAAVEWLAEDL